MSEYLTGRKARVVILILGALSTVSPFSIDMYLAAFPQMAAAFHTTPARISLSLSSYFIGLALGQIIYGPLLDRFGRKPPLYAGMALYIAATCGCMLAPNVETLIAFRFLQALGGGVAQVAAMAMVMDFFPVKESAKIISMLILILGVSPLCAPTAGSLMVGHLGWQWIFITLAVIAALILSVVFFLLPEGHKADKTVSLKPGPIMRTFGEILRTPQFYTYAFAGALSFAGLFIFVTSSPLIFMGIYNVGPRLYGLTFACLAGGFIGSNQLNIMLSEHFESGTIFRAALMTQVMAGLLFIFASWHGVGYVPTALFLFVIISCGGLLYPNAAALALAPFKKTAGSASALLGFIQMGVGAFLSSGVGVLDAKTVLPLAALMGTTPLLALAILLAGERSIARLAPARDEDRRVLPVE